MNTSSPAKSVQEFFIWKRISKHRTMDIYIDGSSQGNPGDAGIGIVFAEGDHTLKNISKYIGKQTNNIAEYSALIFALQEALVIKAKSVTIYSDSELLCKQLSGEYKVRNENIKNLFNQAINILRGFENFNIKQISREQNRGADKLARLAIKKEKNQNRRIAASMFRRGGKSEL